MTAVSRQVPNVLVMLDELPGDPEIVGSKAANLLDAARRGLQIPRTAVVPASVYMDVIPDGALTPTEIRARIGSADLGALDRQLREALRAQFGAGPFAVRSSSNMEDGADRSFAGQYESFLDVPLEGVAEAVRGCWLSLWGDEALSYRGVTDARPSMAVIVQPFIHGRLGGVAFSADPVTGNPFQIIVESSGDPTAVTDGSAPTAVRTLDLHSVVLGRVEEPYQSIADACLKFGRPVDIEWIWDAAGRLQILQVRPITGLPPFAPANRELARYALPVPEPVSRLGASLDLERNAIYQQIVRKLTTPAFRARMLGVYGQLYGLSENHEGASAWRVAAGLLLGALHVLPYAATRARLRRRVERGGTARHAIVRAVRESQAFYRSSIYVSTLYNYSTGVLVRYVDRLTDGRYTRALLYNLLACPQSIAARRDESLKALAARLTVTNDADWLPRQTPEFARTFREYCREFAYVFADTNPRDPHFGIDHALAYRLLLGQRERAGTDARGTWTREVFDVIRAGRAGWFHAFALRLLLWLYRRSVGLVKEDRNHLFYIAGMRIREFIEREETTLRAELGLREIEDLYFLTVREIQSGAHSPDLVRYRRLVYSLSRDYVNPYRRVEPVAAAASPASLTGVPCSPGVARGPVVFVRTRRDFVKVTPGSILVTDNIRPFWTPVLATANGLLSSTGNILSHGASVAREHGVPAVFGLGDAVFSLAEGEVVTVNGLTGQVQRGDESRGSS